MLGFTRTHKELLRRVSELAQSPLSLAGPSGALALIKDLEKIEGDARTLQADLEEAERKAREDEEREKQRAEWQRRVEEASSALPTLRDDLESAERQCASLKEELGALNDAIKSATKAEKKDLAARRQKYSDELKREEKRVKSLLGEIAAKEELASEEFEFRPSQPTMARSAKPGPRFVPSASSAPPTFNLPAEALPEVGALREHKKQRYLVIHQWEEFTVGEQTAARLNAKLVAPETV